MTEYQKREIYAYGRYINCQILNWQEGEPPKYLVCHPLHPDYEEDFLAQQAMGSWCRVDLRDVLNDLLVLKSKDGKFTCSADHAVEVAYLMNCAEAEIIEVPLNQYEIGEILANYAAGDMTYNKAMKAINKDL